MNIFLRTLALAQSGDAAALEALVTEFAADVRHVCMAISLDNAQDLSRSDLNQEAWMRIWLQLNQFVVHHESTDPRQQFRVWLKQTARNEVLRVLEKRDAQKRKPPQPLQGEQQLDGVTQPDGSPSSHLRKEEEKQRLTTAIARLDEPLRSAIRLCFLESCSVQSMADQLGLSYSEARTRLARAVTELRKTFVDPFP